MAAEDQEEGGDPADQRLEAQHLGEDSRVYGWMGVIVGIHIFVVMFLIDTAFGIRSLHYLGWLVVALMLAGPAILILRRFNRSSLPFKFRDGTKVTGRAKTKWVLIAGVVVVAQVLIFVLRPMLVR